MEDLFRELSSLMSGGLFSDMVLREPYSVDNNNEVRILLPGVDRSRVHVSYDPSKSIMTVTVEGNDDPQFGASRTFNVECNDEDAKVSLKDGVLTISPSEKVKSKKVKEIEIQ